MPINPRGLPLAAYTLWALSTLACSSEQPEELDVNEEQLNSSSANEELAAEPSPSSFLPAAELDSTGEKQAAEDFEFYHRFFREISSKLEVGDYDAADALVSTIPDQTDLDLELHQHLYILSGSLRHRNCDGARNELAAVEQAL